MENTFLLLIFLIALFGALGVLGFIADVLQKREDSKAIRQQFEYKLTVLPKHSSQDGHLNAGFTAIN
jgi:hypothetical protein